MGLDTHEIFSYNYGNFKTKPPQINIHFNLATKEERI